MPDGFGAVYLDASAAVKLIKAEPETQFLRAWLAEWPQRISSEILRVEMLAFADRTSCSRESASDVLANIRLLPVTHKVIDSSCQSFDPPQYALDAIHLASAISVDQRQALAWFVSYDQRQCAGAQQAGLATVAPR